MLAIETLLGALTGYFTNDIAIRQLFAKNGVVVRERAQFTKMIVQVLQEQIIDEETVQTLAERPEMATLFARFLRTLLAEELPYTLSDCSLAELDEEGALRRVLQARLETITLADAALDAGELAARLDAVFADAAFQQSLALALSGLAKRSLAELGPGAWWAQLLERLEAMDATAFAVACADWKARLQEACAAMWQDEAGPGLSLGALCGFDGAALVKMLEQLILEGQHAQQARWLDVLKDPALQEQVYILAERLLPALLRQHLPTLVAACAPILQQDCAELERLLLESVAESGASPMICEAIAGLLQQRFAATVDGPDWLSALLARFSDAAEAEQLSQRLADLLLSLVVQAIDGWRRVGIDDAAVLAALHEKLLRLRLLMVWLCDTLLAQPLRTLVSEQTLQTAIHAGVDALQQHYTPQQLAQRLRAGTTAFLEAPLSAHILTPERQAALLTHCQEAWMQQGRALLARCALNEVSLKEALQMLLDRLYQEPLGMLICRSQQAFPYEKGAAALRDVVFRGLRPFLGRMTEAQLDALSHEEMRSLVLDMLGREMRPLAYLGGGIGALAGAATGVAMEMSGVTPEPETVAALLAARTGMYGVVGYGTNVAAVTGLFRPYRKKLGVQGLLSKNQPRFAEKMKELAASYVLNDEIWRTQVQAFTQHLQAQLDDGLPTWTAAQMDAWYPQLLIFAREHAGALLAAALQDEHCGAAIAERLCEPRLLGTLGAEGRLWQRGIARLALREVTNGAGSQALRTWLQRQEATRWTAWGNKLLAALTLPANQESYVKVWTQLLPYYKVLPEKLAAHSDGLAALADEAVRKQLSFTMLLGYQMAGGARLIEAVLQVFFTKKLPGYLFRREDAFAETVIRWMADTLAGQSVAELGITLSENEGIWGAELFQRLSQQQSQQFLLALARQQSSLSQETEAWLLTVASRLFTTTAAAFSEKDGPSFLEAVAWEELIGRFTPVIALVGDGVARKGALSALISLPPGTLQARLRAALCFSPEEQACCTVLAGRVWQLVAPVCVATVIREGQALLLLVDVPGLVEERVRTLSPARLEALVRGIAQPYFKRVERMGWLGAVVAIPATLASRVLGGF